MGKSTLVNALIGEEMLKTQDVRAHDSRGRHTTRHRHLILLPERRGLLIDTPGMRELQLWTPGEARAKPSTTSWSSPPAVTSPTAGIGTSRAAR